MALSDNLVAYYSLEDANDALGSNNLTNNATVTFTSGQVANAATLNGTSQYLSHASNATFQTGDIDFTVAAWVKATSLAATIDIIAKWTVTGNHREYLLTYNQPTNRFRWFVSKDGTASVSVDATTFGAPSTATYYFIAVWHDSVANVIGIRVNGGGADTTNTSTGVVSSTSVFGIGSRGDGGATFWPGQIDEVGLWKRVLTSAEITDLYNGGSGRNYAYISAAASSFLAAWARNCNNLLAGGSNAL